MGGNSVTSYEYTGAKIHKQGLGFLGFTTLVSKNSGTNRISTTTTTLDITAPYASFKPLMQETYSTIYQSGKVLSSSIINFKNSRIQSVINAQIWYSYPDTITETNYLTGVSVTTTNDYNGDTNGNLYSTKKDFGGGFTETTLFEDYIGAGSYKPVNGIRFPNKPRKITVIKKHPDDPDPFTSQTLFTYNATNGNVLTKTENTHLNDADKEVTTTYSNFDKFGNAQSVNTTGTSEGNNVNLTKTFVYEDLKGRFLSSSTDPLGITVSHTYEPVFGNELTEKFSNLATQTNNTYDAWGRLSCKSLPDGNTMSTTINWSSVIGAGKPLYYTYSTNSANSLWSKTFYDELGRTLKDESIGFADIPKYSLTKYNNTGQIDTLNTYLGSDKTSDITYSYDLEGRVVTAKNNKTNSSVVTKYTYGENTVTTTSDGKDYTKIFNNWGNLKKSKEPSPGDTIYYKYFSNGKPSSIKSPASTITMLYDSLGQQTSLKDPDAGTTTYRYDPFNRLTYQKRATGEETKQVYDTYGRLQKVTDGLGTMTYQYEYFITLGAELGKMKKTTEANGTYESYTYDALGRVKTTTKYIDASNVYTYTNVYDQSGNITQVTYPGGDIVNNQFDKYGILNKVLFTSSDGTNTNTPVWTLNTSNATTLAYGLGNGLTTTKSYDASKGYSLSSIVTANGPNQVQSCYYDFNSTNGNLNSREDRRKGYALKETFGYDGLDRLTNWAVAKNGINTFSNSLAYNPDKSGNIDSKSDIGIYGFDITGKPHQLSSLQLTPTSYIPSTPHDISYTSFGKVEHLSDSLYNVLFTYGADQQRCKSEMKFNTTTLYTMYYGGAYEKKVMANGTTTQYTYIPAGDGLAAVFIKTGTASGTLNYIHTDHLGSITALTNTSGTIAQEYAYDPWGRRRNPTDWTFTNVPAPTLLSRGFTGHEHIDELTLINMNGRIYDPVLGMFISPDNYVQSPTQSQNFNRFSYAMGNPLKFTDPDGNFFFIIAIGYALMQADIAGNASKNHGGDYWSGFGKSAGVSAAGMLVGAGVGSVVGGLFSTATSALGSTLSGAASGALSGGITGGVMNAFMGGSFKSGFINGAIGGGLMGGLSGYMKYSEQQAANAAQVKAQNYKYNAEARQSARALAIRGNASDVPSTQLNTSYSPTLNSYIVDSEMSFDGKSLNWYDNYSDGSQSLSESWNAHSGGPAGNGRLPNGRYSATNLRVRTNAPMVRDGVGFSVDLDPQFNTIRDLLRIHPDGQRLGQWWQNNGTAGCIGLQTGGASLRFFYNNLSNYFYRFNSSINVSVNY